MKKFLLGSVALVVTALIATSLSPIKATAASSIDENAVDALKSENAKLRAEIAALRKRAAQRDSARPNPAAVPPGEALAMATKMPVKAPAALPAAPPPLSGYLDVYTGWARTNFDVTDCDPGGCGSFSERFNGWVLGGAGRVNYWWASNASLQFDAQAEGTSYQIPASSGSGHFSTQGYLIGGHVNWRDSQRGLLGVFAGAGDISSTAIFSGNARHGIIGLEGQMYLSMLTLYGQVGYDTTVGDIDPGFTGTHAWFARGTVRYYVNPNLRLEGTALYADSSYDFTAAFSGGGLAPQADSKTWLWRAKAEYKFTNAPFSIYLAYQGARTTTDLNLNFIPVTETVRITDNRIVAGLRFFYGENTLQWGDTMGASLDIIDPLSIPTLTFGGAGGP